MPIDCVLFDYGGVVCPDQDPDGRARMADMLGFDLNRFARFWRQYRMSYDYGIIDGHQYWSYILRHSRVQGVTPEALVGAEIPTWYGIDETLLDWASRLRDAGIRTGVLSNMPPELVADTKQRPWIEPFDPLFFSSDIKEIKPYAPIYEHVIGAAGHPADRILFLDDLAENVRGAQRAGLQSFHYTGNPCIPDIAARYGLPA